MILWKLCRLLSGCEQPGCFGLMFLLVLVNQFVVGKSQANVIQAAQQAVAFKGVKLELESAPARCSYSLLGQINA